MLSIFSCDVWLSTCLLWRNVYLDFLPIFNLVYFILFFLILFCSCCCHYYVLRVDYGKEHSFNYMDLLGKVMSLPFNTLSRIVTAFLARSKCLLISWLQSPSSVILESQENEICHCFPFFSICLPWSDGTRCHDLCFVNVEF